MIYFLRDHKCGFKLGKSLAVALKGVPIDLLTFYSENKDIISKRKGDKFVIFIRNPKEIVSSGYLYHKICKEYWCIKENGLYYGLFNHMNINTKNIEFAKSFSEGKTYQSKLNDMKQNDGMLFELTKGPAYLTLSGLNEILDIEGENVLFIDVEDYTFNYEVTIQKIIKFLNLDNINVKKIYKKTNVQNMPETTRHITNKKRDKTRYKKYWFKELTIELNKYFPGLIKKYENKIL